MCVIPVTILKKVLCPDLVLVSLHSALVDACSPNPSVQKQLQIT